MNNLSCLTINSNRGIHKVEYYIYTSIADANRNNDPALKEFLSIIGWDNDDFEHPIVRIYNILDGEGKPIDESHIKADMHTLICFIDNQFKDIDYPTPPIYFTSILDLFDTVINSTEAVEKYKMGLAYECMQFELAGFFNIRAILY